MPKQLDQIRAAIIRRMESHDPPLSEYALARLSGVSSPTINRYLKQERSIKAESLLKLFAALGLRVTFTDPRRKK